MTKLELLGHDEKGNKLLLDEIFELERSHLRWRVNTFITAISTGLYQSRLWNYHQREKQQKLLEVLTGFYNDLEKWDFVGEKKQLELDF